MTGMPTIFREVYGEGPGISGLNYISLGVGLAMGAQLSGHYIDKIYNALKERNGGVGEPEFRVRVYQFMRCYALVLLNLHTASMVPGALMLPVGLLISGWCADQHVHWIGVDIGLALVAASTILVFQAMQTYVVDNFTLYAASGACMSLLVIAQLLLTLNPLISTRRCVVLPLPRWVRVPALRSSDVQPPGVWEG